MITKYQLYFMYASITDIQERQMYIANKVTIKLQETKF